MYFKFAQIYPSEKQPFTNSFIFMMCLEAENDKNQRTHITDVYRRIHCDNGCFCYWLLQDRKPPPAKNTAMDGRKIG
jgi:hypothetical protein